MRLRLPEFLRLDRDTAGPLLFVFACAAAVMIALFATCYPVRSAEPSARSRAAAVALALADAPKPAGERPGCKCETCDCAACPCDAARRREMVSAVLATKPNPLLDPNRPKPAPKAVPVVVTYPSYAPWAGGSVCPNCVR